MSGLTEVLSLLGRAAYNRFKPRLVPILVMTVVGAFLVTFLVFFLIGLHGGKELDSPVGTAAQGILSLLSWPRSWTGESGTHGWWGLLLCGAWIYLLSSLVVFVAWDLPRVLRDVYGGPRDY